MESTTPNNFIIACVLLAGIAFELAGAAATKGSNCFQNIPITVVAYALFILSGTAYIILVSMVDLGVGWAVSSGVETVGAILIGFIFFKEEITIAKLIGIIITVFGIIILSLTVEEDWTPWPNTWNEPLWTTTKDITEEEMSKSLISDADAYEEKVNQILLY